MSARSETIIAYIDEQLQAILETPGMWGSRESVELQILQLLEFRSVTLRPELERREPRTIIDSYHQFIKEQFPEAPPHPLFCLVDEYRCEDRFMPLLKQLSERLCGEMQTVNIFADHDLVLRLWLHEAVSVPRASSLTSYYETLHRVLRALSRPKGTRGRASVGLEEAIDFEMPDVVISPANGERANVVLALDQRKNDATVDVRRGLQRLVTVNEWAAGKSGADDSIDSLRQRLPWNEDPARIVTLAMELVPGDLLQKVEMGGRLLELNGKQPFLEIKPSYAERMFTVVKQSRPPIEFNQTGVVRAIDGQQHSMRIKTRDNSYKCFFSPTEFEKYREVLFIDKRVSVSGKKYTTTTGKSSTKSFVEVEKLAL